MKEFKIFAPSIMFKDHITSAWCQNVATIEGKLPIHPELKNQGIYVIYIDPVQQTPDDWHCFGLPFLKSWTPFDASDFIKPVLAFEIVSEESFGMFIELISSKEEKYKIDFECGNIEVFGVMELDISKCEFLDDLRMVMFVGPLQYGKYAIKDLKLIDKAV